MPYSIVGECRNTGRTHFKKGAAPWNKGKSVGNHGNGFKKGQPAWNKNMPAEWVTGKKHPKWKGENVGYFALHNWVKRQKGAPILCAECGGGKNLEWANISHEYKRELEDWISL